MTFSPENPHLWRIIGQPAADSHPALRTWRRGPAATRCPANGERPCECYRYFNRRTTGDGQSHS